jgi:hypothetical protein
LLRECVVIYVISTTSAKKINLRILRDIVVPTLTKMPTSQSSPLTPIDTEPDVELLRAIAVSRGIKVKKIDYNTSLAAVIAASLWCAVIKSTSLEYSARFGLPANEAATSILSLAAGSSQSKIRKEIVSEDPPARSSRRSITLSEDVLERFSTLLADIPRPTAILAMVAVSLAPGAGDHRIAAALDVVESHLSS